MIVKRHVETVWGNGNVLNLTVMVFIHFSNSLNVHLNECTLLDVSNIPVKWIFKV